MGLAPAPQGVEVLAEAKVCRDCRVVKPVDDFYKKRVGPTGIQQYLSWCKLCSNRRSRGYRSPVMASPQPMTKVCPECTEDKPLSEYNSRRTGRQAGQPEAYCRPCQSSRVRTWEQRNPERYRDLKRVHYERKGRDTVFQRKYGITVQQRDEMLDEQGGRCVGCCVAFTEAQPPVIDHRHDDGCVRGILCRPCNVVLGLLQDDPVRLRRLANYLEER